MVHKLNFFFQFNIKLFSETKWLSLSFFLSLDVCILCLLFLAYHVNICIVFLSIYHNKIFHQYGNVPKLLQNLYKSNNDIHTHFTRHAHLFHSMRGNNEFIYRTFVFQSVLIWNKLIQNIDIHVSYPRFKHLLKDFLLTNSGLQLILILHMLYLPPYTSIQIAVIIDYLYNIYLNHILDTKLSELSELYVLLFSTGKK